jgi:hypothetical protein
MSHPDLERVKEVYHAVQPESGSEREGCGDRSRPDTHRCTFGVFEG